MGQGNEPADSAGVMAVPPELQQVFDEAIAAHKRSTTAGVDDAAPARDAAVAAWEAITRHAAFASAPQVFRAHIFNLLALALHLRYVAGGAPADVDASIAAFETAAATVPTDSASRAAYLGSLGYALLSRLSVTGRRAPIATRRSRPSRKRSRAPRWTLQSGRAIPRTSALYCTAASTPVGCRRTWTGRSRHSRKPSS